MPSPTCTSRAMPRKAPQRCHSGRANSRAARLPAIKATINRARELEFLVFACADSIDEAKAIAQLHPDIINPEPTELDSVAHALVRATAAVAMPALLAG